MREPGAVMRQAGAVMRIKGAVMRIKGAVMRRAGAVMREAEMRLRIAGRGCPGAIRPGVRYAKARSSTGAKKCVGSTWLQRASQSL
jgi:hypothetical protein